METKINLIFLFLGFFSIILAFFDFILESDLYGGLLAVAWGLLFIFFSVKNHIEAKIDKNTILALQTILILFLIVSGLLKFLFKI